METIRIWEGEKGKYQNFRVVEIYGEELGHYTELYDDQIEEKFSGITYRFFAIEDGTIVIHRICWSDSGVLYGNIFSFENIHCVAKSDFGDAMKKAGITPKAPVIKFEEWCSGRK